MFSSVWCAPAGYSQLIKTPIDLGTVKRMIKQGVLASSKALFEQLVLMFDNALLYVQPCTTEIQLQIV